MIDNKYVDYAPLSSSFTAISMVGFFVSLWITVNIDETWGVAFMIAFLIMFISSFVSMHNSLPIEEHMDELAVHRVKEVQEKRKEL